MRCFYEENGLIVQLISPCSYMLNPIELGLSKIKACVRRKLDDRFNGSFIRLIRDSPKELTESDLGGHCEKIF